MARLQLSVNGRFLRATAKSLQDFIGQEFKKNGVWRC